MLWNSRAQSMRLSQACVLALAWCAWALASTNPPTLYASPTASPTNLPSTRPTPPTTHGPSLAPTPRPITSAPAFAADADKAITAVSSVVRLFFKACAYERLTRARAQMLAGLGLGVVAPALAAVATNAGASSLCSLQHLLAGLSTLAQGARDNSDNILLYTISGIVALGLQVYYLLTASYAIEACYWLELVFLVLPGFVFAAVAVNLANAERTFGRKASLPPYSVVFVLFKYAALESMGLQVYDLMGAPDALAGDNVAPSYFFNLARFCDLVFNNIPVLICVFANEGAKNPSEWDTSATIALLVTTSGFAVLSTLVITRQLVRTGCSFSQALRTPMFRRKRGIITHALSLIGGANGKL